MNNIFEKLTSKNVELIHFLFFIFLAVLIFTNLINPALMMLLIFIEIPIYIVIGYKVAKAERNEKYKNAYDYYLEIKDKTFEQILNDSEFKAEFKDFNLNNWRAVISKNKPQ